MEEEAMRKKKRESWRRKLPSRVDENKEDNEKKTTEKIE